MSQKVTSKGRANRPSRSRFPIWLVVIAAVVLVAGAAIALAGQPRNASASLPLTVSVAEASAKRDSGAFILDVREPSEWADYHIAGATLIPLGTLADRVKDVPRDKDVVVVCHSGNRSQKGRDILLGAGFSRVTSMTGGLIAWGNAGLPLVKGQ
ncbi:MAG TPA: rhodanese-like domain-containing protein [Anaerolineae bacterium]|jgi:rhodanese-related sulfurtransferase